MDKDKLLELKASAYAERVMGIPKDAEIPWGQVGEFIGRLILSAYIDGFRAGELEGGSQRRESEEPLI